MNYIKCPNCGAQIDEHQGKIAVCSFCGTKIEIKYSEKDESKVLIPRNVEIIAQKQYFGNLEIKRVIIPENIKVIEESAFENCINLEEIVLTDGLVEIGRSAFKNTNIRSLIIPKTVKNVRNRAFSDCRNLKEVTLLAEECKYDEAFKNCFKLDSAKFDIRVLYPSLYRSIETHFKKDGRSTYRDVFQNTPFMNSILLAYKKSIKEKKCFLCNTPLKFGIFGSTIKCPNCGCDYSYPELKKGL